MYQNKSESCPCGPAAYPSDIVIDWQIYGELEKISDGIGLHDISLKRGLENPASRTIYVGYDGGGVLQLRLIRRRAIFFRRRDWAAVYGIWTCFVVGLLRPNT